MMYLILPIGDSLFIFLYRVLLLVVFWARLVIIGVFDSVVILIPLHEKHPS